MGRRRIQRCSTMELKDLLLNSSGGKWFRPVNSADEVFPGILLGDADTALSTKELKDLGVTHVLNAAHGQNNNVYNGYVSTNPTYYAKIKNLKFMGIPAMDMPGFYIRPFLREAADFIHKALKEGGRVLVHCMCGISRSASLVCAFLMLKRGMTVQTALSTIKKRRNIFPNQGFLSQLCDLDYELRKSGAVTDKPEEIKLPPLQVKPEPEPEPLQNPKAFPRFTLVPSRPLDTYTSTKNYVVPRRARSVERYEPPRYPFPDNPLVDAVREARSPVRELSPSPRPISMAYSPYDEEPKVFDTYRRYARNVTSPIPHPTRYDSLAPYDSPKTRPYSLATRSRNFYYDYPYTNDPAYDYINNLTRYYDSYKYSRASPDRTFSSYPYTEKYIPAIAKYPSTYRTLNHSTLTPFTSVWI